MATQPSPTRDQILDMRARGKEVADIARQAKRFGGSVNLKGKIVSYLRTSLNEGVELQVRQGGAVVQPSKEDVSLWANYEAGEIMQRTSDVRRANRMSDFGYAVEKAQIVAFKKGWSLAAGKTELDGVRETPRTSSEAISRVPSKYLGPFIGMMHLMLQEKGNFFLCSYTNVLGTKWLPMKIIRMPDNPEVLGFEKSDPEVFSDGAITALMRAGILERVVDYNLDYPVLTVSSTGVEIYKTYRTLFAEEGAKNLKRLESLGIHF